MIDLSPQVLEIMPTHVIQMYQDVTQIEGREFRTKQFYELFIAEGSMMLNRYRNEQELKNTLGIMLPNVLSDTQYYRLLTEVYLVQKALESMPIELP